MIKENTIDYRLTIFPAIKPKERHKIQDAIERIGYRVTGGGHRIDMSYCDISFRGDKRDD